MVEPVAQTQLCVDCRYFNPDEYPDTEFGGCHRYPPQFDYVPAAKTTKKQLAARFPSVTADDWCGEFQPKPPVEAAAPLPA